eukprot:gene31620-42162_t
MEFPSACPSGRADDARTDAAYWQSAWVTKFSVLHSLSSGLRPLSSALGEQVLAESAALQSGAPFGDSGQTARPLTMVVIPGTATPPSDGSFKDGRAGSEGSDGMDGSVHVGTVSIFPSSLISPGFSRGATASAGACGAVVLASHRDAVALLHGGLGAVHGGGAGLGHGGGRGECNECEGAEAEGAGGHGAHRGRVAWPDLRCNSRCAASGLQRCAKNGAVRTTKFFTRPVTHSRRHPNCLQGDTMEIVEERLRGLLLQGLDADAAAYQRFLKELSAHLRAFLRRRLAQRPDEVEDLVQETLLAVHNQRHTYRPDIPLTARGREAAAPGSAQGAARRRQTAH